MFKKFWLQKLRRDILILRAKLEAEKRRSFSILQNLSEQRFRASECLTEQQNKTLLLCREVTLLKKTLQRLERVNRQALIGNETGFYFALPSRQGIEDQF